MEIIAIALSTLFILVVAYDYTEHKKRMWGENYGRK